MQDIFGIYIFTFIVSFIMYLPTVRVTGKDGTLRGHPFFRFLGTIIMSMPAGVPAVMIFSTVVSLQRLRRQGIEVLYPGQLKMAANVDIACFDKTGTLTGSEVSAFVHEALFGVGGLTMIWNRHGFVLVLTASWHGSTSSAYNTNFYSLTLVCINVGYCWGLVADTVDM